MIQNKTNSIPPKETQTERQKEKQKQNRNSRLKIIQKNRSKEETADPIREMFHLFDAVAEDYDDLLDLLDGRDPKTLTESEQDILINFAPLLKSMSLNENQYVYDLYYMSNEMDGVEQNTATLFVDEDQENELFCYDEKDEETLQQLEDEDDSNDENNWRNDYPDEDEFEDEEDEEEEEQEEEVYDENGDVIERFKYNHDKERDERYHYSSDEQDYTIWDSDEEMPHRKSKYSQYAFDENDLEEE